MAFHTYPRINNCLRMENTADKLHNYFTLAFDFTSIKGLFSRENNTFGQ